MLIWIFGLNGWELIKAGISSTGLSLRNKEIGISSLEFSAAATRSISLLLPPMMTCCNFVNILSYLTKFFCLSQLYSLYSMGLPFYLK